MAITQIIICNVKNSLVRVSRYIFTRKNIRFSWLNTFLDSQTLITRWLEYTTAKWYWAAETNTGCPHVRSDCTDTVQCYVHYHSRERESKVCTHTGLTGRDWTVSTTWLLVALLYRRGDKHRKIVIAGWVRNWQTGAGHSISHHPILSHSTVWVWGYYNTT